MTRCAICGSDIGIPGIEVTYLICKRCGLNFCGEICANQHICGTTRKSRYNIYAEGIYRGMAICFGIVALNILLWPSIVEVPIVTWPYVFIPIVFIGLFIFLIIRERRLRPKIIADFNSKAPHCPICGKKTEINDRYRRYYCNQCDKYL